MTQYWSGDHSLYAKLQKDQTALGNARLHYFWINKGPWSSLDSDTAFLPDVPKHKPLGANFYPESMTKAQFESWVRTLSGKQQELGKEFFHRHPRRRDARFPNRPLQRGLQGEPAALCVVAEGSRGADRQRNSQALSDDASRRLPLK